MIAKRKFSLVMLPTTKPMKEGQPISMVGGEHPNHKIGDIGICVFPNIVGKSLWAAQHFYVLSDNGFKEPSNGTLYYDGNGNIRVWGTGNCYSLKSRNIVASTDKEITPESWINVVKSEWIINYWNENKKLPFVELEMDKYNPHLLKTNSDGSVIVIEPERKSETVMVNVNPILDYTFATRLKSFVADVKTNCQAGEEEKMYFETMANELLEYQRVNAKEQWEKDYLERTKKL